MMSDTSRNDALVCVYVCDMEYIPLLQIQNVKSTRTNSNLVDTCMVHVLPTCDVFMISKSCDNCEMIFMNIFSVQNLNASMNFGIFYSLSIYMNLFMKTVIFIREVNLSPFFVVHLFFMIFL